MKNVEIKDKGWKNYLNRIDEFEGYEISAGVHSDESGIPDKNGYTMADIAMVQEFGSDDGRIPERSVHRDTFEQLKKSELPRRMAEGVRRVSEGKQTPLREAHNVGLFYAGKLRDAVQKYDEIPNAESTVKKKGRNDPLVDSGATVNAINHKVSKKRRR